jgi:very-short-patch-repair endonuclease
LLRERWRGHVAYCRYVLYEAGRIDSGEESTRRRLVNGHSLITELGIGPGPALGRILAQLDEAQAVGEIETREAAIAYARTLLEGTTPPPAPSPPAERGSPPTAQAASGTWRTSPELWDKLKPLAREHRHEPTPAERVLWERLRRNQVAGVQFRRQHPIDRFIVDFYCGAAMLVVEVDGPIHDTTVEEDAARQQFLEALGLRVLRFTNEEVLNQTDAVVARIHSQVAPATDHHSRSRQRPNDPLSASGEGAGGGVSHD